MASTQSTRRRGLSWRTPLIVALPGVLAYAGWCAYLGHHRTLHLVNGLGVGYRVQIDRRPPIDLPPHGRHRTRVSEGERVIRARGLEPAPDAVHLERSATWWARPFARKLTLVNIDRAAVLRVVRPDANDAAPRRTLRAGEAVYVFERADPAWPGDGRDAGPTRVDRLCPGDDRALLKTLLSLDARSTLAAVCRWRAVHEPEHELFVRLLPDVMPAAELRRFLEAQCARRPIRVEMHRTYQDLIDRIDPRHDLEADYRRVLAEAPNDPVGQYLLGRVATDHAEARQRLESAAPNDPTGRCHGALAWMALCAGEHARALRHAGAAVARNDDKPSLAYLHVEALTATGHFERAARYWSKQLDADPFDREALLALIAMRVQAGQINRAHAVAADFLARARRRWPAARVQRRRAALQARMAAAAGDRARLLQALEGVEGDPHRDFMVRLLERRPAGAARLLDTALSDDATAYHHLQVAIVAEVAGVPDLAAEQRRRAGAQLRRAGREARRLAAMLLGDRAVDVDALKRLTLAPQDKRTALLAIGLSGHRQLIDFADAKLNYDTRWPHVLLRCIVQAQADVAGGAANR